MSETIGIIGLGRMGMVAAKKYIRAGYKVVGYAEGPRCSGNSQGAVGLP